MDKIREMLSKIMQAEDLTRFETLLTEHINTLVTAKEAEIKTKYDLLTEEYTGKKIAEGVEAAKKVLIEEYEGKMTAIEEKVNKQLDLFLESEIIPQVTDETIGKIALNESLMPIVKGMKNLLESHNISIDESGTSILKEAKEEILGLTKQLDEKTKSVMLLNEKLEASAKLILIQESTENLKPEQKKRVTEMFSGKGFDETEEKLGSFVKLLLESDEQHVEPKNKLNPDSAAADPKILLEEKDPKKTVEDPDKIITPEMIDNRMLELAGSLVS
jgi:hypothetical protein